MFVCELVDFRGICTRLQAKLDDWLLEDVCSFAALPASSIQLGSVARPAVSLLTEPEAVPPLVGLVAGSVAA